MGWTEPANYFLQVGGGGGGKPGIAQGGGTDVTKIEEALERGVEMVRERVG